MYFLLVFFNCMVYVLLLLSLIIFMRFWDFDCVEFVGESGNNGCVVVFDLSLFY